VSQEKPAGKMFTRQVDETLHVLCADLVGPLPGSKLGNTVLLVFLNSFSKWVELVPLRRATVPYLERAFRERILSRFGIPRTFVCDNGTQFTTRAYQAFYKSLGMELQLHATSEPHGTDESNREDDDSTVPRKRWQILLAVKKQRRHALSNATKGVATKLVAK